VITALAIAGSDPTGGAGVQADLKTFASLGIYGLSVITAITSQNTAGVGASETLQADLVTAQIETLAGDIEIHATKTGMLGSAAVVEAVAAAIAEIELPRLVVDPVIAATSGMRLLDDDGIRALAAELVPRAMVVTPNIPEAEILAGLTISTMEDRRTAALRIRELGAHAVVITGGHGEGDEIIDLLSEGEGFFEFQVARAGDRRMHGTGCAFASAIAAHLALGESLVDAVMGAQTYVAGAIRHGIALGRGRGTLDHFWQARILRS
jgi:hydroxymethylpyrimidine/phosphomethylpyrimidine kinase